MSTFPMQVITFPIQRREYEPVNMKNKMNYKGVNGVLIQGQGKYNQREFGQMLPKADFLTANQGKENSSSLANISNNIRTSLPVNTEKSLEIKNRDNKRYRKKNCPHSHERGQLLLLQIRIILITQLRVLLQFQQQVPLQQEFRQKRSS